jgi:hypothetical protein
MVLGTNNGWSSMMSTQNLQPAPGSNPFLNLNNQQQPIQAFNHVRNPIFILNFILNIESNFKYQTQMD